MLTWLRPVARTRREPTTPPWPGVARPGVATDSVGSIRSARALPLAAEALDRNASWDDLGARVLCGHAEQGEVRLRRREQLVRVEAIRLARSVVVDAAPLDRLVRVGVDEERRLSRK